MFKNATFAQTRPTSGAIKLVAVANVMSAFTTFYGAVDELKHGDLFLCQRYNILIETDFCDVD